MRGVPSAASGHAAEQDPEFRALFDKTCLFRTSRKIADNHRKHSVLIEYDEAEEKAARQAFAKYYKAFLRKACGESQRLKQSSTLQVRERRRCAHSSDGFV